MKKSLTVIALVLVISISMVAGTLAMYTITIGDLAEGSVVAKEFILLENGTDTFATGVKIAPGETVDWTFSVKNYDGNRISETAMDLDFAISLAAVTGKTAIAPLVVTVKEITGEGEDATEEQVDLDGTINTATGTGTITFTDEFLLDEVGQEKTFTVSVEWPWETAGVDDIDYAGATHGTALTVSVTGTQASATTTP